MAGLTFREYDSANYIETEEDVRHYLEALFEDGDAAVIAHGLGVIARSKGMSKIAEKTGLGRESLYKSLSKAGNPEFLTVLKVVQALGLQLTVKQADAA
jgi:probable addiction module antidote protein